MQDYKSLCAAIVICSTQVNIQTDTLTQITLSQLSYKIPNENNTACYPNNDMWTC